jgi:tripartite-type tricarboxylate transporter receptor subunit TctC
MKSPIARAAIAAVAFAAASSAAFAQYPDKPITMIVPFPPGGVADTVARPVADALSRELKQPVVIENKPGAGGAIGMGLAAKAKPDGYTVLLALASYTVLPEADKVLGRAPQYQLADLKPIARFTADPTGARGPRRVAVEDLRRVRRRGEGGAGQAHVRVVGQLRHDAHADGDARARPRRAAHARAVHRRGARRSWGCSAGQVDAVATGRRRSCST